METGEKGKRVWTREGTRFERESLGGIQRERKSLEKQGERAVNVAGEREKREESMGGYQLKIRKRGGETAQVDCWTWRKLPSGVQ
jgi:hypothetical protein